MSHASRRLVWLGLLILCASWLLPVLAAAAERPKIGLVLSGGGARGAAHIGVLKVLEERRIPIDYIAGTSMGSIIGALYASGMSADEIATAIALIDWDGIFNDDTRREDNSFRRKQDDRLFLVKQKPGVKNGEVRLPMALVQGQKFDLVLRELLLPVSGVRDFDDLPIPFRAVAADLATGDEVVLGRGDLAKAVRASMAVPAAFAAVEIDGRTLVDGGIANNLPVSVVRRMGADIVIAVDIGTPLLKREEIGSLIGVLEQLTGFLTVRNTQQQIASLGGKDLLIVPPLDKVKISSGDFSRHAEAIAIGEQEARLTLASFAGKTGGWRLSEPAYQRHLAQRQAIERRRSSVVPQRLDFVEIDNRSSIRREVLVAHLGVKPGDPFDLDRIEAGIARAYGLGFFEKIGYQLVQRDGGSGIRYEVYEKSWGVSSLQLGLELFSAFGRGSGFNLGGAYTHTPIGPNAGEWRSLFSIGEEDRLVSEIYYPLDPANRWFLGADLGYEARTFRLFQAGQAQAEYATDRFGGHLRLGRNLGDWGRLMLQYDRAHGSAEVRTGTPSLVDYSYDVGRLSLMGSIDTLDDLAFPSRGQIGNLFLHSARKSLGASGDYDQIEVSYNQAMSWGEHSLEMGAALQGTFDDNAPVEARFRLGGLFRLSGLEENALSGQHMGLLRGIYRYRLNDSLVPVYLGASLELGNTWDRRADISLDEVHWGGSLFLGADTPLGPAYLGYGQADQGDGALYLTLGRSWN